MALASIYPIKLSSNDTEKLDKLVKDLNKVEWENGEYYFHNFVDYYQLPQIIRVEQGWNTNLIKNQSMYLQTLFDRYLIIASPLSSSSKSSSSKQKYLIPDWFQGECRIVSKHPVLKKRWWIFQGTFELYRFDLPRSIKVLADTPAHMRKKEASSTHEWDKIVLRKSARLNVVRREQYQSRIKNDKGELIVSEPKEAFVLQDPKSGHEFILPPGVPLRFATLIEDTELHAQYKSHEGTFTFPEIMMRYDFPLDIEVTTHLPADLPDFKPEVRLEKFCVAKSVLGFLIGQDQPKLIELSPLTQYTLHCAKCLTFGLPREGENVEPDKKKEEKFDEKDYQRYEEVRSKMNMIFDDSVELHKSKIQLALPDELDCVETAFEISVRMKAEEDRPVDTAYLTLEEAIKIVKQTKDDIPFPKPQPKRFTVHASADPSNPYNEVIDFEDVEALNESVEQNPPEASKKESSKSESSKSKSSSKKSRDKPDKPTNQSTKRPALVVQQLPPPIILPPEAFERTVKAIPDKLYTSFIPATVIKKMDKKENEKDKDKDKEKEKDKHKDKDKDKVKEKDTEKKSKKSHK
ncbi:unnamed protein product [Rotaria sordida]|uniref:Uncharacterized protein n=1 Tax=Rotaria sordida TaxID=392033 RepID=A0A818J6C2_9BILA|nr:unnamed protein product [Rotaria sordida]CAF0746991.1 unnamed protein product [Rotaria sordida]CAF0749952.1 unnamed protein product [Rotaria sordida]CAF0790268.1 unnamed protein product [Rotaria sordida]CAF3534164.1 unnamed protein product [Rotaria sordida]